MDINKDNFINKCYNTLGSSLQNENNKKLLEDIYNILFMQKSDKIEGQSDKMAQEIYTLLDSNNPEINILSIIKDFFPEIEDKIKQIETGKEGTISEEGKEKDNHYEGIKPINIESIILNKNQKLAKIIPNFVINYLKKIIHQDDVNKFLKLHSNETGVTITDSFLDFMDISYEIKGEENLPTESKHIFASNHPLGGPDGIMLINYLGKKYKIKFPVNDILLNIKNLSDIFLPVNKHGKQARETAKTLNEAYSSDSQIIIFPAGLVSRKQNGIIKDLEWKKSFISKAISHQRDIIPIHISGQNSNFFYNLANLRKSLGIKANIEMLYLVDELYKHKGNKFTITIGKPVSYESLKLNGTHIEWANRIKELVYSL